MAIQATGRSGTISTPSPRRSRLVTADAAARATVLSMMGIPDPVDELVDDPAPTRSPADSAWRAAAATSPIVLVPGRGQRRQEDADVGYGHWWTSILRPWSPWMVTQSASVPVCNQRQACRGSSGAMEDGTRDVTGSHRVRPRRPAADPRPPGPVGRQVVVARRRAARRGHQALQRAAPRDRGHQPAHVHADAAPARARWTSTSWTLHAGRSPTGGLRPHSPGQRRRSTRSSRWWPGRGRNRDEIAGARDAYDARAEPALEDPA